MGLTDAAVHVEHDRGLRLACVHPIDPGPGQIGQGDEVYVAGQPCGLKAAHLTRRSGTTVQPATVHHRAHCRIMRQAIGIVDVLIAGEAAEHRLPKQASQQVAGILATAALRQHRTCEIREAEHVIQFSMGQDAGVGGDATAVEFQLQSAVEIDPQATVVRFTRRVFHEPTTMTTATR
jgi:hypothetical protein